MKPILKYLFQVEYIDGEIYNQTPDDLSKLDDKRSEFYDVLQSGKKIHRFSLIGDGIKVTVDLLTGLFSAQGVSLLLESQKLPTLPDEFELIFYRQWTQSIDVTYKLRDGDILKTDNPQGSCEYFIGWKCLLAGKEYVQKLAVA